MTTRTPTQEDMYMALELEDKVSLRIWETVAATLSYAQSDFPSPLLAAKKRANRTLVNDLPNDMDFAYRLSRNSHFRSELANQLRNDIEFRSIIQSIIVDTVRGELQNHITTTGGTTHAYKRP